MHVACGKCRFISQETRKRKNKVKNIVSYEIKVWLSQVWLYLTRKKKKKKRSYVQHMAKQPESAATAVISRKKKINFLNKQLPQFFFLKNTCPCFTFFSKKIKKTCLCASHCEMPASVANGRSPTASSYMPCREKKR